MKIKLFFLLNLLFSPLFWRGAGGEVFSQQPLTDFINDLKKENELQNASISLCAMDAQTGTVVCEYNPKLSLTPASTMKIITTACALQLLGKDFRYETLLQYSGTFDKESGVINGDLYIKGSGDPSLNSEYFRKEEDTFYVANKWAGVLKDKGVKKITGQVVVDISCFEEDIPANWIWGDMGNYFGAAPSGLSYTDNKYYIVYKPAAKTGDSMSIRKLVPQLDNVIINSYVKAGGKEDNAMVYRAPYGTDIRISGTLPAGTKALSIEGSLPYPEQLLAKHLQQAIATNGIELINKTVLKITAYNKKQYTQKLTTIYTNKSATLDKIIFFTNLHSNNQYAESIFRTIALKKGGWGSNTQGIQTITNHLKTKGFDANGLFITDGSGLSRSDAVTSEHLTKILYMMCSDTATKTPFISSLPIAGVSGSLRSLGKGTPLENNFKAKSGYITRVRSYAGYMKTKSGKDICVSLIINNFNGSPSDTKKRMEQIFMKIYESY